MHDMQKTPLVADKVDNIHNKMGDPSTESITSSVSGYILNELKLDHNQFNNLKGYFEQKFPDGHLEDALLNLKNLKPFAAGGNLWESGQTIDEPTLLCMRWVAGIKMEEVLGVLKFDLSDSNLIQDLSVGNIGTAQRWSKTVTGGSLESDDEMMSGRYASKPRLATFPNNRPDAERGIPITKRIDVSSVCSHHFLPYGTLLSEQAYAIVSYIPKDYVLGISKLQRVADWVARRPTIQEDLVQSLWETIADAAQTEDVYVGIFNARHTCEYLRGSQSHDGAFTTEIFKGKFKDSELRRHILNIK